MDMPRFATNVTKHSCSQAAIECRSVWKAFGNRSDDAIRAIASGTATKESLLQSFGCVVAVANASFSVYDGETFCIMGLSGSGKSTLIRHFNRLIEPSAGEVVVRGENVCKLGDAALRELRARHVSMVFQHVALLPYRTVIQNVALSLEVQGISKHDRLKTANTTLETVGLSQWADRYPLIKCVVFECHSEVLVMDFLHYHGLRHPSARHLPAVFGWDSQITLDESNVGISKRRTEVLKAPLAER
jgi:ABC-type glutathione transport system ATPase component